MENDLNQSAFQVIFSHQVDSILRKIAKKDPVFHERIERQLMKIARDPYLGKPLRYVLRNQRRVHVGSFVIVYEIKGSEIHVVDFDHHDKIYGRR